MMKSIELFSLHKDVSFAYPGSIDEGIQLLSSRPRLVGRIAVKIKGEEICIWLYQPRRGKLNFLVPYFLGRFESDNGKAVLRGTMQIPRNARILFFLSVLGVILVWTFLTIRDYSRLSTESIQLLALWMCLTSIALMVMILLVSRVFALREMENIEKQIVTSLDRGSI